METLTQILSSLTILFLEYFNKPFYLLSNNNHVNQIYHSLGIYGMNKSTLVHVNYMCLKYDTSYNSLCTSG